MGIYNYLLINFLALLIIFFAIEKILSITIFFF